jgi:hypothetical protein
VAKAQAKAKAKAAADAAMDPEASELELKLQRFYEMVSPERLKDDGGRRKVREAAKKFVGKEKTLNGEPRLQFGKQADVCLSSVVESLNKKYGKNLETFEGGKKVRRL